MLGALVFFHLWSGFRIFLFAERKLGGECCCRGEDKRGCRNPRV
jgi:hypothetical protein